MIESKTYKSLESLELRKFKVKLNWETEVVAYDSEDAADKAEIQIQDWINDGDLLHEFEAEEV